jgi:hypothetical protein
MTSEPRHDNPHAQAAAAERVIALFAKVVCIDPGVTCGLALYSSTKLSELWSGGPGATLARICSLEPDVVVIEDARLDKAVWQGRGKTSSLAAARAVGSNVGMNRGIGFTLIDALEHGRVKVIAISPSRKGSKLNAKLFAMRTGWLAKSNQHERDAAMLYLAARYEILAALAKRSPS